MTVVIGDMLKYCARTELVRIVVTGNRFDASE